MRAIEVAADRGSLADGAVAAAEIVLAGSRGTAAASGAVPRGEDAATDDGAAGGSLASSVNPKPIRSPVEVVVHITATNLEGTTEVGDGLSAEICRRLLCDAGVVQKEI